MQAGVALGQRVVRRQPVGAGRRHAAAAGGLRPRLRRAVRRLCRGRCADDSRPVSAQAGAGDTPQPAHHLRRARRQSLRQTRRPCAQRILSTLARRAYRRPADGSELETLLEFYDAGRRASAASRPASRRRIERMLVSFNFLFRIESTSAEAPPAAVSSAQRSRPRVAAVVLPVEQHSRRRAADAGGARAAERAGGARAAGAPDAARSAIEARSSTASPASGSACARRRQLAARSQHLPGVRREPPRRVPAARPRCSSRASCATIAASSISSAPTIRSSTSGSREHYGVPRRLRRALPPVTFTDGVRGGLLGQGGILMVTSYPIARRRCCAASGCSRTCSGMPPPPPPPDVPDLETDSRRRPAAVDARADGDCTARIRRARCATCAWIRSASRSRTSTPSAAGARRATACPWMPSSVFADGTPIDGVRGPARASSLEHRDSYVDTFATKLLTYALGRHVDYRDQPAIRTIIARRGRGRLSLVGHHSRHRQEHAVPDEEDRVMMITKKALSRRTVLQGARRGDAAAVPRCDGAGDDRAGSRRRRSRRCASARSTCRTASFPASGSQPPKARASSSRRRCSRSSAFRDRLLVMSGLDSVPPPPPGERQYNNHADASTRFLTDVTPSRNLRAGVSIDQIAAKVARAETRRCPRSSSRWSRSTRARRATSAAAVCTPAPSPGPVRPRRCRWSTTRAPRSCGCSATAPTATPRRGAPACSSKGSILDSLLDEVAVAAAARWRRPTARASPAISTACATSSGASSAPWRTTPSCRPSIARPAFPKPSSSTRG